MTKMPIVIYKCNKTIYTRSAPTFNGLYDLTNGKVALLTLLNGFLIDFPLRQYLQVSILTLASGSKMPSLPSLLIRSRLA